MKIRHDLAKAEHNLGLVSAYQLLLSTEALVFKIMLGGFGAIFF
jgi:hypothetical protein